MTTKSLHLYLRLGVVIVAALSWNNLLAYLTPYYVTTFTCTPTPQDPVLGCRQQITTNNGIVNAVGQGLCHAYANGTQPPLYASTVVYATCRNTYTLISTSYLTPQANDPSHYAISAAGYSSGCQPNSYVQNACDKQYTVVIGGCELLGNC